MLTQTTLITWTQSQAVTQRHEGHLYQCQVAGQAMDKFGRAGQGGLNAGPYKIGRRLNSTRADRTHHYHPFGSEQFSYWPRLPAPLSTSAKASRRIIKAHIRDYRDRDQNDGAGLRLLEEAYSPKAILTKVCS
jgi:hypothetical protein